MQLISGQKVALDQWVTGGELTVKLTRQAAVI